MSIPYHESVRLNDDGEPIGRGFIVAMDGLRYWQHSKEYKMARRKMRSSRRAVKFSRWKELAAAEKDGEFVPVPTSVFPVGVQYEMWEAGKFNPTFWQDLYERFGPEDD